MFHSNHKQAFTLIEILVVVSIIGILSALIYVNFNSARNESRNRTWQTELKEVQLALEFYKSQNGHYPPAGYNSFVTNCGNAAQTRAETTASGADGCVGDGGGGYVVDIIEGLTPDYITELPHPDLSANSNCNLIYEVDSGTNASWYKFTAENCLVGVDVTSGITPADEQALCPSTCNTSSCGGSPMDASFTESPTFYESLAVYSEGGRCQ